jgi:nitroreductase
MDVLTAIFERRAIRDFADRPIERSAIERVIDAAIRAPSAMNRQPWAFFVMEGRGRLARISAAAKRYLMETLQAGSPLAHYRDRLADPAFNIFYNAPQLIVVCARSAEPQTQEDCCLAAQNLMLAAYAAGLGTCVIGFARPWLNLPEGKAELGLPAGYSAVAPIVIGVPKTIPPATERRPAEIHWLG